MAKYLTGGEQTTVNSTITELFPSLWFNNNRSAPRSMKELSEFIKGVDLNSSGSKKTFVTSSNATAAKKFIAQAYSLIEPKMLDTKLNNAFGIIKYLYDLNKSNPIKNVMWGYREKPSGVPKDHAGDIFVFFKDSTISGISLKAGTAKSSEPKMNSYVRTTIMKPYWQKLDPQADAKLKLKLWKNVYSKIPGLPNTVNKDNYFTLSGKAVKINKILEEKMIDFFEVDPSGFDKLYQIQNKISREALCNLINSSVETTKEWISEEFRLEKPQKVPLVLVKAIGDVAEEAGDKLVSFLPRIKKVHAYLSPNSVQEWFIDVMDGKNNKLTLLMTIRSDSEFRRAKPKGKLGKLVMLKLLYRGVKK
jgi:hypothetical protein